MTGMANWILDFASGREGKLPRNVYRYVFATSALHQLALLTLTAGVALLAVVPLELQRRIVNDLVKHRPFSWAVVLCAVYAGVVFVQGGAKLALNIYRGWVGERAKRDLRRRVHTVIEAVPASSSPAAEAQGISISMIVAEVEPIGGFVGESVSEPLLQAGIMASVSAYLIHIDPWMALAAGALFIPQFVFVPLLQAAVNRRTGARIRVLRQLGVAMIDRADEAEDERRIQQAFALDMGIFKIKFTMNFLMNLCTHLQIISALLVGGWWIHTNHLEIGGVVAFISGIGRLIDPWGDLVNYFRDVNVTQVKYRLLADAVDQLVPPADSGEATNTATIAQIVEPSEGDVMRCRIAGHLAIALLCTVIAIRSAWADAGEGKKVAQRWCSSCHVVEENQPGSVPQGPPSFHMVAKNGMTDAALRGFLSHPHGAMPDLALTRTEIDDLIAYIRSQR